MVYIKRFPKRFRGVYTAALNRFETGLSASVNGALEMHWLVQLIEHCQLHELAATVYVHCPFYIPFHHSIPYFSPATRDTPKSGIV